MVLLLVLLQLAAGFPLALVKAGSGPLSLTLSELQMDCSRVSSVTRQSSACSVQSMQDEAQGVSLTVFAKFLRSTKVLKWFNTKSIRQTLCSYVNPCPIKSISLGKKYKEVKHTLSKEKKRLREA